MTATVPPAVAATELIQASWGNSVRAAIAQLNTDIAAALVARAGHTFQSANPATIGATAATWTSYGLGSQTLPSGPGTYDLLIITGVQVSTVGYARLITAVNGTQVSGSGESTSTLHTGSTQVLVHSARTVSGPGIFTVEAQVMLQTTGSAGPAWTTITAVPSG
jgi:hypothetical protein